MQGAAFGLEARITSLFAIVGNAVLGTLHPHERPPNLLLALYFRAKTATRANMHTPETPRKGVQPIPIRIGAPSEGGASNKAW